MKNPLTIFKSKPQRQQDLKERVLKNREAVLDVMAQSAKGSRQCPFLMGSRCIGGMCEFFQEYKNVNSETGKEFAYFRCVFNQMNLLLIELCQEIRNLQKQLQGGKNEPVKEDTKV